MKNSAAVKKSSATVKSRIFLLIAATVVFAAFQNCSDIKLAEIKEQSLASVASPLKATGDICLPTDETLESLFVTNLNAKAVNGQFQMDSDGDGLSDLQELSMGTDPVRRRTHRNILDSICQKADYNIRCESLNVTCVGVQNGLGLNDCDVQALQLDQLYSHQVQGLDSDKDGIPDILEIRAGTFPNISDASEDPDHDGKENQYEIGIGSDVRVGDAGFPEEYKLIVQKNKLPPTVSCNGEHWQVNVSKIPMVRTSAFASDEEWHLSHSENQNVIQITLKTRPKTGVNANAKIRVYYKKINVPVTKDGSGVAENFSFSLLQMPLQGEVEP